MDHGYYWVVKIERVEGEADLWLIRIEQEGEKKCALAGVIELATHFNREDALAAEREVRACKSLVADGKVIQKYDTKLQRMGCCEGCEEHAA